MGSLKRFWADEAGVIDVTSMMLVVTLLVLGMIVGLSAVRSNIAQEFGDVAQALDRIDQTYSYTVNGVTSQYVDGFNFPSAQTLNGQPAGVDVQVAPTPNDE